MSVMLEGLNVQVGEHCNVPMQMHILCI